MRSTVRVVLLLSIVGCGGGGGHGPDAGIDGTPVMIDAAPQLPCGNGVLDTGEQCDAGSTTASAGCEAACHIETGVVCPTAAARCRAATAGAPAASRATTATRPRATPATRAARRKPAGAARRPAFAARACAATASTSAARSAASGAARAATARTTAA